MTTLWTLFVLWILKGEGDNNKTGAIFVLVCAILFDIDMFILWHSRT